MKLHAIVLAGLSLLLTACGSTLQQRQMYKTEAQGAFMGASAGLLIGSVSQVGTPVGAAVGGIVGGAVGNYWYNRQFDGVKQALAAKGGQLIILGDKVRMIVPTDAIFVHSKDKLDNNAGNTLWPIANYLKQFHCVCITIAGYTDAMPNRKANIQLSKLRAERIASYLWNQGFREQCLRVEGHGREGEIASNETLQGRAFNRRIEITLWQGVNP